MNITERTNNPRDKYAGRRGYDSGQRLRSATIIRQTPISSSMSTNKKPPVNHDAIDKSKYDHLASKHTILLLEHDATKKYIYSVHEEMQEKNLELNDLHSRLSSSEEKLLKLIAKNKKMASKSIVLRNGSYIVALFTMLLLLSNMLSGKVFLDRFIGIMILLIAGVFQIMGRIDEE